MSEQDDGTRAGQGQGQGQGNLVGRSVEEFVAQLRGFTDRARGLASGAVPSGLSLPRLPSPPGAMSAAQVGAVASAVRGQRQLITGLIGQLQAFDEQLAVFERVLEPVEEWSRTWARLEQSFGDVLRRPPSDPPPAGTA
jgi:hypothetical protein